MRAVILEVDEAMLAERERLGLDRRDEMWQGILHMVPQPSSRHQVIAGGLIRYLTDAAALIGCYTAPEIAVFGAGSDYRVPDVAVFPVGSRSTRGIDGPPVVVIEIRSPGDETTDKVPWYLARGAESVVAIDRDTLAVELFAGTGKLEPDADGLVRIAGLRIRLGPAPDGDALVVETETATHRIVP